MAKPFAPKKIWEQTNELTSPEVVAEFRKLITEQNVTGVTRMLADGFRVWLFTDPRQVIKNSELEPGEKEFCAKRFADGEKWAGIFRRPEPEYIPGVTPDPRYNTHGYRIDHPSKPRGSIH